MVDTKKDVKKTTTKKATPSKAKVDKVEEVIKPTTDNDVIALLMKQIADLQNQMNQPKVTEVIETVKEEVTTKPTSKKVTFQSIRNEEIMLKRVAGGMGVVIYKDKKTGDEFVWREIGDTEYVTGDIMKRMGDKFLKTPWLKIMDNNDAIDIFNLRSLYDDIELIENVDKIIDMDDSKIYEIINRLTNEYKQVLATNIMGKISSEELSNINVIRKFERLLGKEFLV